MALLEDRTAVFIIRIWCEQGGEERLASEWRGSIEHVRGGERAFFRHLEAALEFMQRHLRQIGVETHHRFWERIAACVDDEDVQESTSSATAQLPTGGTRNARHPTKSR